MKLRIKGNSIRLRLDRRDLWDLVNGDSVRDSVRFGPGADQTFSYSVQVGFAPPGRPRVIYEAGQLSVLIDHNDLIAWHGSDLVGFDHEQQSDGVVVRVLLEKDFACVDRPAGEESDDAYAFPNPATAC